MTPIIPDAALNSHVGILGKTGSGKSYTGRGLVERLLKMKRQVVIIDPTGAWWGLRSGFEIPIFGGRHGDIEINDTAGEAVAGVIVDQRTSAIVDLSLLSGGAQRRFMRGFAHRLRSKPPGALYFVLDEADEFLPQQLQPDMMNLFGDLKWMVRRGRLNGFRVIMITQRPAEIAKAVLTQIETLIAHRLTAPQDRKAIEEWVKGHHTPEEARDVLSTLASLGLGEAWVWSPDIGFLKRAKMPAITTFDSGKTPEPGQKDLAPPRLSKLNLSAIAAALKPPESAIAIARERRAAPIAAPDYPDLRGRVIELASQLAAAEARAQNAEARLTKIGKLAVPQDSIFDGPIALKPIVAAKEIEYVGPTNRRPPIIGSMNGAERKPLAALAAVYPSGMTEAQWAVAAGFKRTGGTWSTYKSRLRTAGAIEKQGDRWYATESGAASVGPVESMPEPGPDLARWWAGKLGGVSKMTEVLIESYPDVLERSGLADALEMSAAGGTFSTYLSRLAGAGVIERGPGGTVRLTHEVMGQ